MYIKPKANAESLWDINEDIAMEALLYPAHEDVPGPWDPDISIDGSNVILSGSLSAGGGDLDCKCVCTLPVNKFSKYFKLEIPDGFVSDNLSDEDLESLWDAGWERV